MVYTPEIAIELVSPTFSVSMGPPEMVAQKSEMVTLYKSTLPVFEIANT